MPIVAKETKETHCQTKTMFGCILVCRISHQQATEITVSTSYMIKTNIDYLIVFEITHGYTFCAYPHILAKGKCPKYAIDVWKTALLHVTIRESNAKPPLMTELNDEYIYHHASVSVVYDDVIKWKHRWIPHTKASDAELWCFLWSASE